jgi:hypothetical protein
VLGAYGGVTLQSMILRKGGWRENEQLPSGTIIPGDVVAAWPITNRMAMANQGRIRYFMSPAEAEAMAPMMQEQIQESTALALHEAAEERESQLTGQPTSMAIRMAALRAAKAMKRQQEMGAQA